MRRKQINDSIFEALFSRAVVDNFNEELNSLPPDEELAEVYNFSKAHESRMKKLFSRERNKELFKAISKYATRAAAILLILTTAAAAAIYGVEAWRIRVRNFIIEVRQNYTTIEFDGERPDRNLSISGASLGFIPESFTLEESYVYSRRIFKMFTHEDLYFSISARFLGGAQTINTRGAEIRTLRINGFEALLSIGEIANILVWHDNVLNYMIAGDIDEYTLIRIAENMEVEVEHYEKNY